MHSFHGLYYCAVPVPLAPDYNWEAYTGGSVSQTLVDQREDWKGLRISPTLPPLLLLLLPLLSFSSRLTIPARGVFSRACLRRCWKRLASPRYLLWARESRSGSALAVRSFSSPVCLCLLFRNRLQFQFLSRSFSLYHSLTRSRSLLASCSPSLLLFLRAGRTVCFFFFLF